MNMTEISRFRELMTKPTLTDNEIIELDDLEIKLEAQEEAEKSAMAATYTAIQREEINDINEECLSLAWSYS